MRPVIEAVTRPDVRVQRLRTVPSVGPVTAAAFVATIDDVRRFRRAHEVEAYLGLVPRELSSGESQRCGRITKAGEGRRFGRDVREGIRSRPHGIGVAVSPRCSRAEV